MIEYSIYMMGNPIKPEEAPKAKSILWKGIEKR